MKLLLENWRGYVNEATYIPDDWKSVLKQAITESGFWELPNTLNDLQEPTGDYMSAAPSPATNALETALNEASKTLATEVVFEVETSDDKEYELGPGDPYERYPNNWMTLGQYRYEDGLHLIYLQLRAIAKNYNFDDLNSDELVKVLATTINHEMVHYFQLKKQAENKGISDAEAWEEMRDDPKQISTTGLHKDYLSLHNEIDAFAHEAAEHLIDKYGTDGALNAIRKLQPLDLNKFPDISDVVQDYAVHLKDNPVELNKFRKKLYQQIKRQSNMNNIFEDWRGFINENRGSSGLPETLSAISSEVDDLQNATITFDFDNTLLMTRPDENWGEVIDGPNLQIIQIMNKMKDAGARVLIVTSRKQRMEGMGGQEKDHPAYQPPVLDFIEDHNTKYAKYADKQINYDDIVYTDGDLKAETLVRVHSDFHFDDDEQELLAANNVGVPTYQVRNPHFSQVPEEEQ